MSLKRRIARLEKEAERLMEGKYKRIIVMNLFDKLSDEKEDPAEIMLEILNTQKNM